jgi:hypothetical protein
MLLLLDRIRAKSIATRGLLAVGAMDDEWLPVQPGPGTLPIIFRRARHAHRSAEDNNALLMSEGD